MTDAEKKAAAAAKKAGQELRVLAHAESRTEADENKAKAARKGDLRAEAVALENGNTAAAAVDRAKARTAGKEVRQDKVRKGKEEAAAKNA